MVTVNATVIGREVVEAKLIASEARILATNRLLVTAILDHAKPILYAATPVGPGHFGYHGRDTIKVVLYRKGPIIYGQLRAAVQLYWREFGTGAGFRRTKATRHSHGKALLSAKESAMASSHAGGERAFMTAHKAVGSTKSYIRFFYGGMAKWWKS